MTKKNKNTDAGSKIFDYIGKRVNLECKNVTYENVEITNVLRNKLTLRPIIIYFNPGEDEVDSAVNFADLRSIKPVKEGEDTEKVEESSSIPELMIPKPVKNY